MAATLTYVAAVAPTRGSTTQTATAANIGTASANRRVVVLWGGGNTDGRNVLSCTIGGVAATLHGVVNGDSSGVGCASLVVTTGTTADIVITYSDTVFHDPSFYIYNLDETQLVTPDKPNFGGNRFAVAGTTAATYYNAFRTGITIASVGWGNGATKDPITNSRSFTEDADDNAGRYAISLNGDTQSTDQTVSVSWAGNFVGVIGAYCWEVKLPVYTVQPEDKQILDGATGVFSATVTDVTSYQWETNPPADTGWVNVSGGSGGTTASYTTPTLARASDNYRRYRLKATNALGDTYSNVVFAKIPLSVPSSYSGIGLIIGASDSFVGEAVIGGSVSVGGGGTAALTSALATASAGTLTPTVTQALTGSEVTIFAGTVTPNQNFTAALTGAFATATAGNLVAAVTQPLTGAQATGQAGTPATANSTPMTGAQATASAGTPVSAIAQALIGANATTNAGTVSPVGGDGGSGSQPLTGVQATASAGTMIPAITGRLTGDFALAEAGTMRSAITQALTGSQATGSAGSTVSLVSNLLSGQQVTTSAGILKSAITQPLTGSQGTGQAGAVSPLANYVQALSGSFVTASAGTFGVAVTGNLTGVGAIASAGTVTPVGGDTPPVTSGGNWLMLAKRRGSR